MIFRDFPIFRRPACVVSQDPKECGLAALATIARHYGSFVPLTELRERLQPDLQGIDLIALKDAGEELGFEAAAGKCRAGQLDSIPLPAIAHMDEDGAGHFLVMHQIREKEVLVADPASGVMLLGKEEFFRRWSGHLLLLKPKSTFEKRPRNYSVLIDLLRLPAQHPYVVLSYCLVALLGTALALAGAFGLKVVLDWAPTAHMPSWSIYICAGLIYAMTRATVQYLRQSLLAHLGLLIETRLGIGTISHILLLPIKFFDRRSPGDAVGRTTDVTQIKLAVVYALLSSLFGPLSRGGGAHCAVFTR